MVEELQDNILSLEHNLKTFIDTITKVEEKRNSLVLKLQKIINDLDFDLDNDNGDISQAKIQFVNMYSKLLNDSSNDSTNKVQVIMKNKQNQDEQDYKAEIIEALSNISTTPKTIRELPDDKTIVVNNSDILDEISKTIENRGCVILPTELNNKHTDLQS